MRTPISGALSVTRRPIDRLAQSVNGHLVVVSLRDFRKNNLCDPGQDQQQADDDKNCDPYDAGRADAENMHP